MVDSSVIDAFHKMWGSFPEAVRLIHRGRTVLAVNKAAAAKGMAAGIPCYTVGSPEVHKQCSANEALDTDQGVRVKAPDGRIRFWSPVRDCPDVFIHFVIFPYPQP